MAVDLTFKPKSGAFSTSKSQETKEFDRNEDGSSPIRQNEEWRKFSADHIRGAAADVKWAVQSRKRKPLSNMTNFLRQSKLHKTPLRSVFNKSRPPVVMKAIRSPLRLKPEVSPVKLRLPSETRRMILSCSEGIMDKVFSHLLWFENINCSRVCKSWHKALKSSDKLAKASARDESWERVWVSISKGGLNVRLLTLQTFVTPALRARLFEWMFQVNSEFENHDDTMFLSTSLVDQYLAKVVVPTDRLQLVGIASMLVASKLLETQFPDLGELILLCQSAYHRQDLLDLERGLLAKLDFRPKLATIYTYLKFLSKELDFTEKAIIIAENTLMSPRFLQWRYFYTASAITGVILCLGKRPRSDFEILLKCGKLEKSLLIECAQDLLHVVSTQPFEGLWYIEEKYRTSEMFSVSDTCYKANVKELIDTLKQH
ncbi:hypothetical protein AAMO2058_001053300 [Amorphochlora amoebiformis]